MRVQNQYSFLSVSLIFLLISHLAWIWEGCIALYSSGQFVNRGFLHGFWLPIYGAGSVLLLLLLGKRKLSKFKIFLYSILICTSIEYITSWILELIFKRKWWDYGQVWLNVQGRICFFVAVIFGIAGYLFIGYIAPFLNHWIKKIPVWVQVMLCMILGLLFWADVIYSCSAPNTGRGITFGNNL